MVERAINADNDSSGTGENLINFVFGVQKIDPTALTASLLIPSHISAFDPVGTDLATVATDLTTILTTLFQAPPSHAFSGR